MAPTSLKGVNGYGLYTTRDLAAGESILGAPDGLAIPVHLYAHPSLPPVPERRQFLDLWSEYMWGRGVPDHVLYEGSPRVLDYQIGFGCLPNHHCVLSTLDIMYPDPPYADGLVNRFQDPSAGAFSYHRGREFVVDQKLASGHEIFLNYGYCERPAPGQAQQYYSPQWTEHMYVTEDFHRAAALVRQQWQQQQSPPETQQQQIRGGRPSSSAPLYDPRDGRLSAPPGTDRMVTSLLPPTIDEFHRLYNRTQAPPQLWASKAALAQQVARNALHSRTPDWIKSHGMCMDHLVGRPSTLPLAGQGAFAKRTIRSGDIVTPAPLMQIVSKRSLEIYNVRGERNGTQLLLNYCFGHKDSALLLCPNTNAVLINHCSHRTKECGPNGPNAAYRWSSGWDPTSDEWRNLSYAELAQKKVRGLAFEIVATRDIRPDDEVFLDYGIEWERAWADHVARWTPPPRPTPVSASSSSARSGPWVSAQAANADPGGTVLESLVSGDIRRTVQHPYLFTGCVYWPTEWDGHSVFQQVPPSGWEALSDQELLQSYSDQGDFYLYRDPRKYQHHADHTHWPCTVLRQDGPESYLVRIHPPPWVPAIQGGSRSAVLAWRDNGLPRLLRKYPRDSIHYFVRPYASDQHLAQSFRHEMRIPDDMFPPQWKNLERQ